MIFLIIPYGLPMSIGARTIRQYGEIWGTAWLAFYGE